MTPCEHCAHPLGWPGVDWTPLVCPSCNRVRPDLSRPVEVPELPNHELLAFVGQGGMGEVYLARNRRLDRLEAVKLIEWRAHRRSVAKRFQREAQVAGQLNHPAILPVYSMQATDDLVYYSMPYVAGPSLQQVIGWARDRDDPSELLRTIIAPQGGEPKVAGAESELDDFAEVEMQVYRLLCDRFSELADGLHTAHGIGIVHRDIKPANILVHPNGTLQLMDFGLVFVRDEVSLTRTGQVMGTPQYMSPEQVMSRLVPVDHRCDVYALGASLYAAALLRPPFELEELNIPALFRRITTVMPARPRSLRSRFPADLEAIALHCLEKDPDGRYSTAKELAQDLRRFVHFEPIQARRTRMRSRVTLFLRRNKRTVRALGMAAGFLLLGLATLNVHLTREARSNELLVHELMQEASSLVQSGMTMYEWSRSHARARHMVDARIWAEEGSAEMDRALERLQRAGALAPRLSERTEAREPVVRKLLHSAFLELMNQKVGRARSALEEAERISDRHEPLTALCAEVRSLTELAFDAFPTLKEAYLLPGEAASDREADRVQLHPGRNPLPAAGEWTLLVTDEERRRLEVPVLVLEPGGLQQRIDVPLSPTDLERSHPDMVLIAGGMTRLGSPWSEADGLYGERYVYVEPFLIGKHEVTNEQYLEFMNSSSFERFIQQAKEDFEPFASSANRNPFYPESWSEPTPRPNKLRHPVTGVSIVEAHAYALWSGAWLPTNDEWEKACRGPLGPIYPWGDHVDPERKLTFFGTKPVGAREVDRSPYGLCDVVGNAAEWTCTLEGRITDDPGEWEDLGDDYARSGYLDQAQSAYDRASRLAGSFGGISFWSDRFVGENRRQEEGQLTFVDGNDLLGWTERMKRKHAVYRGSFGIMDYPIGGGTSGLSTRHWSNDGRGRGSIGFRIVRRPPTPEP